MYPIGRNDHYIPRKGMYRITSTGLILRILLHINNRLSRPNLIDLRRRPTAIRRYLMNMPLTSDWLLPQFTSAICHYPE
jgi:hypothetical protein